MKRNTMINDNDRGILERCIDDAKRTLPTMVKYIRTGLEVREDLLPRYDLSVCG